MARRINLVPRDGKSPGNEVAEGFEPWTTGQTTLASGTGTIFLATLLGSQIVPDNNFERSTVYPLLAEVFGHLTAGSLKPSLLIQFGSVEDSSSCQRMQDQLSYSRV